MRVEAALLGAGPATPALDFTGHWQNELGSIMRIAQAANALNGDYFSKKIDAADKATGVLAGFASGKLISFVVNWDYFDAITAWVGQHISDDDGDRIETLWQMTRLTPLGGEWESIVAGAHTFTRL